MDVTQEFLVLPSNGTVFIYGVRDFPSGTAIGRDAQRLRVVGPVWVRPPHPEADRGAVARLASPTPIGRVLGDGRTVLDLVTERALSAAGGRPR